MPHRGPPDVLKARHGPLRVRSSPSPRPWVCSLFVEKVVGTGIKVVDRQTNKLITRKGGGP
jgi:hypothetical protein